MSRFCTENDLIQKDVRERRRDTPESWDSEAAGQNQRQAEQPGNAGESGAQLFDRNEI